MKSLKIQNHSIDLIFILGLFCLFALCSLTLVMTGAGVYKKTVSHMDANYSGRTALSYITEKIRQCDSQGAIAIGETGDHETALLLKQNYSGAVYVTCIYVHNGNLCELFVPEGSALEAEQGEVIMSLQSLSMELTKNGLYHFTARDTKGILSDIYIHPRSE